MNHIIMQIPTQKSISYPIRIQTDLLKNLDQWLPSDWQSRRIVIITDDNVNKLYGKNLCNALSEVKPLLLSVLPGEMSKNYQTQHYLLEKMLEHHCDRNTLILSLGGGVVGDLSGFIASIYMRGVSYIQIPTSLLAMVDSSVGGKTGINTSHGKNLIGSFWQPICVAIDLNCLASLSKEHMINGLIEAIKMFLTNNADYFHYTNKHIESIFNKDLSVIENIVTQAIKIKSAIVTQDEKERHQRMILNFGHTIGHALEKVSNYSILHGYAVALGILVEAKISQLLGLISTEELQQIQTLFLKLNINGQQLNLFDIDDVIHATRMDKKNTSNQTRYILLNKIGQIHIDHQTIAFPVTEDIVRKALIETREVQYGRK